MIVFRSAVFNVLIVILTLGMAFLCLPLLLAPRRVVREAMRLWARGVIGLLRVVCGVRVELRGLANIPPGGVVLAAKHQSAFDTAIWLAVLPDAVYVLKRELLAIPLYGWHARKAEMIPVDRAGGGGALRGMLRAAVAAVAEGRQLVIFPEGTRTAPGERVPYQPGVVAIAAATGAPVVPVATDSGRSWGRRAFHKHPGVIRVSVLPPLPARQSRAALLAALEDAIEGETAALLAEPVDKSVD